VIVFSTKGNPSLAAKLSGGDYDGDIAVSVYQVHISSSKMCATVLGDATVQNLIFILASAPATNTDSKKL